jgi:aminoglycoside 3-N-acetyltransferase
MQHSYLDFALSLGLNEHDTVFIASDISQMAKDARANGEAFNADLFIESFQRVLSQGTLIVPAFTDNLKDGDIYDKQNTKPTTGALSNKVMRRKDFRRTSDPLHSVLVWGRLADGILALEDPSTFGKQSIFGFLHEVNAKMIIIDVDLQNSFTFVHYVEEQLQVKYRKPFHWKMHLATGENVQTRNVVFYTKRAGILNDLYDLEKTLQANGTIRVSQWGNATVQFLEFERAYAEIVQYIWGGGKLYRFSVMTFVKSKVKKLIGR